MSIRLVTFDALHTIVRPRLPVYVQYAQTFEPYLGALEPDALKKSFKTAFRQLQVEKPAYQDGIRRWWGEVIRRTAVGAGADPTVVDNNIGAIVPRLITRFSSREGYKLHSDAESCCIKTGIVSNSDARMRNVLNDLRVSSYLDLLLISEEVGIEKPSRELYLRACKLANVSPRETVHIGDELYADYYGAKDSGLASILIRRPGPEGEEEVKDQGEDLARVVVMSSLLEVVQWVKQRNNEIKN